MHIFDYYGKIVTNWLQKGGFMNEVLDYIVYPDDIEIKVPSIMPKRQNAFYKGLVYNISRFILRFIVRGGTSLEKIGVDGLKPPYILLCNHTQFVDFFTSFKAVHPYKFNNIATLDGFVGFEKVMDELGCACHRKYTTDMGLVRACNKVLHEYGDILCMYPEARYSNVGTTGIIPEVVGKLVKKNKVPVVVLLNHGHYLNAPFWDFRQYRKVPFKSTMKLVLNVEDIEKMSADEINQVIQKELAYDDHRWQKENNIKITEDFRADGLNKVLYKCPHCMTEGKTVGKGIYLTCEECGKKWEYTELGELKAVEGETEFSHSFVQTELMMPILPIVRVDTFDEAVEMAVKAEHGNRHTAHLHSKNVDHMTQNAKAIETTIFVKNAPSYAGIGFNAEGWTTFTIAGPTGEGITSPRSFTRLRRCVLSDALHIV